MILKEKRPSMGLHNGTQNSVALPVPLEIKGQGTVTMSWSTYKGNDDKDIHNIYFRDEKGALIATHTVGDDEVRPWDKVKFVLSKFRRNALALMDKLNNAI